MPVEKAKFVMPSSPEDVEKIRKAVDEAVNSFIRVEAEKEHIKAITDMVEEEFEMPKSLFMRLAKVKHRGAFDEEGAKHEEFSEVYSALGL